MSTYIYGTRQIAGSLNGASNAECSHTLAAQTPPLSDASSLLWLGHPPSPPGRLLSARALIDWEQHSQYQPARPMHNHSALLATTNGQNELHRLLYGIHCGGHQTRSICPRRTSQHIIHIFKLHFPQLAQFEEASKQISATGESPRIRQTTCGKKGIRPRLAY